MGLGASPAPFKDGGRVTPVRPQLSGFVTPGTGERRGEERWVEAGAGLWFRMKCG